MAMESVFFDYDAVPGPPPRQDSDGEEDEKETYPSGSSRKEDTEWATLHSDVQRILKSQRAMIHAELTDPHNRIHSINEDAKFVDKVAEEFASFPLLANLRCGSWYVDPKKATNEHVYFKSTDGHMGQWGFSLRRSNLHLLPLIVKHSGILIVDSTRRGKRFPDALSKTIPIWCAVINQAALHLRTSARTCMTDPNPSAPATTTSAALDRSQEDEAWDQYGKLCTPPSAVGRSENAQIEERIDGLVRQFLASAYPLQTLLPTLAKPLHPVFVSPSTDLTSLSLDSTSLFYPVICVSASKRAGESDAGEGFVLDREAGWAYVQGSGDDHESWSLGLTPTLFWNHRDLLLSTPRNQLDSLIKNLVKASKAEGDEPSPSTRTSSAIAIADTSIEIDLSDSGHASIGTSPMDGFACILVSRAGNDAPGPNATDDTSTSKDGGHPSRNSIHPFAVPIGKKALLPFLSSLPSAISFVRSALGTGKRVRIVVDNRNGEREEWKWFLDVAVGVALVLLTECFDDQNRYQSSRPTALDKDTVRARLQWIVTSTKGAANPSRLILKWCNEFFMSKRA